MMKLEYKVLGFHNIRPNKQSYDFNFIKYYERWEIPAKIL
jgi:hypothetical protein